MILLKTRPYGIWFFYFFVLGASKIFAGAGFYTIFAPHKKHHANPPCLIGVQ
jgi:hypothetical protein